MRLIKILLAPKLLFLLALLFTVSITVGSLISTSSIPKFKVAVSDKLIHSVSYFILMVLWFAFVISKYKKVNYKVLLMITASLAFVYGIIIEVLQGVFTSSRTADIFDILANGMGIIFAAFLLIVFQRNFIKLKSKN